MSPSDVVQTRGGPKTVAELESRAAAFEERQNAKKSRKAVRNKACAYRGKQVSAADAYSPKGVECCKLYECALHGLCTLNRVLPQYATCAQCGDYVTTKKLPDPDDGRNG